MTLEHEFLSASLSADRSEKKTSERRLEPMLWHLAWDGYALAAAALGQVCLL